MKMATLYRVTCTDCPFNGKYRSQAVADSAYRRHSCDRWNRRASESMRYRQRMAQVDRTPKPCLHKEADHQHGTYACYVLDSCRCLPCASANADYEAERVRLQAYGRWNGLVDAEPARQHVRSLMEQGMGLKRIVAVSDVSHGQLWKLMYGKTGSKPSVRIKPATEAKILAVKLDLADGATVDSTGTVRRIQALIALGWSQSKIAGRLGIAPGNFTPLVHGRTGVTAARDRAVRALYEEWSMRLPPQDEWRDKIAASRSRSYAARHGWLPPLAWDDETLDDPNASPLTAPLTEVDLDEAAVMRRMNGEKAVHLNVLEQAEVVRRMQAGGHSQAEIERRTGINPHRALRVKEAS
jgi:hypothetical protein